MNSPFKTLKAIKVALKEVNYNDKKDMQLRLRIIEGFVDNALEEAKPESTEYKEVYDDEAPDSIIGTEDGI